MQNAIQFGASIFPANTAEDFIETVSGVLTDNLPVVLLLFAFVVGVRWAFKLVQGGSKGKLKI